MKVDEEPVSWNSVRSLNRRIAGFIREDGDKDKPKKAGQSRSDDDDGDPRLDYLDTYRSFVSQRAFPNDTMDWLALDRGRTHASAMKPAGQIKIGRSHSPFDSSTWQFIGPSDLVGQSDVLSGRVSAVAFDPNNSQTMYAGGGQGGLWKSVDSGANWKWLSASWSELAVNCLAIDPTNPTTIYVGRGDYHGRIGGSYGLMKSTDGGSTWSEIAEQFIGKVEVSSIVIDPTNSNILIAGTSDSLTGRGYLYRSTNGGAVWTRMQSGGYGFAWPTIAASAPSNGSVRIYAVAAGFATSTGNPSRLYKSDDHGLTWQLLPSPVSANGTSYEAYSIGTSPTNPNNVYVLDSENIKLYASSDQGKTWADKSAKLPQNGIGNRGNFVQGWYDFDLKCGSHPNGSTTADVLYLDELLVNYSLDGGNTWTELSSSFNQPYHVDQHSIAICPTNPNLVLLGSDGGIYSALFNSAFSTGNLSRLSKTLGLTMFYRIAAHPTNPSYVAGGTQDNGSVLATGDTAHWSDIYTSDGVGSAINQTNPLVQYMAGHAIDHNIIMHTADGWQSSYDLLSQYTLTGNLANTPAVRLDPQNQNLMYTGTNYLYQWNESTQKWSGPFGNQGSNGLTNGLAGAFIVSIAVAPTDSNRIYTGAVDGGLWMSTDRGVTWKQFNSGTSQIPTVCINSISVSPTDPNDILVAFNGSNIGYQHLYRCANTMAASPIFTSVSGKGLDSLPDVALNAIARDLTNPLTTWWVAMDVGVFVTIDSGVTWFNAGAPLGLPNIIVQDLISVPGTGYLVAGTYGRGMWNLQIAATGSTTLKSFTVSPTTVISGTKATGTVSLTAPAPPGGAMIILSSASVTVATVPGTVTIPAGSTSSTFTISTNQAQILPTTAILTAAFGGISLNQTLTVSATNGTQPTAPWPKFHQNSKNSGVGVGGGSNGLLRWSYKTGNDIFGSSAAVGADGTIYVGSNDGYLYAFTPTGDVKWQYEVDTPTAPIVGTDGTVYVNSYDGYVRALSSSGSLLWRSFAGGTPNGWLPSPAIGQDGTIYVGSQADGNVYAFTPSGDTKWKCATGGQIESSPAVGPDGTVYVGSNDQNVYAISEAGKVLWTYPTGGIVLSSPAIGADGSIYFGSFDGYLYALDHSGGYKWTYRTGGSIYSSPSVGTDGTVYVGSVDQYLYALNSSGAPIWKYFAGGPIHSSPSIGADGTIYVGSDDSGLHAVSPLGSPLWTYPTSGPIIASAAIGRDGVVYVGSEDFIFYAIGTEVNTVPIATMTVNPTSILGGGSVTGTVTLTQPAPSGGDVVTLSSSDPSAMPPAMVVIVAGATQATFTIQTNKVTTATNAVITAQSASQSVSATLKVLPFPILTGISVAPTSVMGGANATGTVTLSAPALTGGLAVSLKSNTPSVSVPSSVTVPAGSQSTTFAVATTPVQTSVSAVITGTQGSNSASATLQVLAPGLSGLSIVPSSVIGGTSATGTITLTGNAPTGGISVSLSAASSSLSIPASITVPAGSNSTSFAIKTSPVASDTSVTVTGTLGSDSVHAVLIIKAPVLTTLTVNPNSVVGGTNSTGTLTLSGLAPSGGSAVSLSSSSLSAKPPITVTIAAGSATATFVIATTAVASSTTATITGTQGSNKATATLTISPPALASVSVTPTSVTGGTSSTGTVTLNAAAPTGGIGVTLASSSASAVVPASVTVLAGATSATFSITTSTVSSNVTASITGTLGGAHSATLTILPAVLTGVSVSPTTVIGGNSSTGTVTLNGPAPTGGAIVSLSSSSTSAKVPASIPVVAGATTGTFTVVTVGVAANVTASITAKLTAASFSSSLTIQAPALASFSVSPTSVVGGTSSTGSVTLTGVAPSGGMTVTVSSSSANAMPPTSIVVPAGSTSASFTITTTSVTSNVTATITATLGTSTKTAALIIQPLSLVSISVSPSTVVGGSTTTVACAVTLNGPAPSTGATVTLSSSNTKAATVPASVTIASGSTSATFTVTPLIVASSQSVSIKATFGGGSQSTTLTVNTLQVSSLIVSPSSVIGGTSATGTVTLNAAVKAATVVKLSTSSTSSTVPASVTVATNASSATFTVTTKAVAASTTATIKATLGSSTQQASLTIQPATLLSLTVSPTTVKGSSTTKVTGTVTISGPAPTGGFVVKLASSNTSAATVPATVTIAAGKTTASFTVAHMKVLSNVSVTLAATLSSVSKSAILTVTS